MISDQRRIFSTNDYEYSNFRFGLGNKFLINDNQSNFYYNIGLHLIIMEWLIKSNKNDKSIYIKILFI